MPSSSAGCGRSPTSACSSRNSALKKSELTALLQALDVRPSRKLGQNFLFDDNLLAAIAVAAAPAAGEVVIEIGAGTGALTEHLLPLARELILIEYDCRLAEYLSERYGERAGVQVLQADACRVDFDALSDGRRYRCISNLPYAAAGAIIERLLSAANPPAALYLLLQLEMAERLAAAPGTKVYGALSVRVQSRHDVCIARRIPPTVFWPPPKIASALIEMLPRQDGICTEAYPRLSRVVSEAFAQRRKKLVNRLGSFAAREVLAAVFADLGIAADARAEDVTVSQYIELTQRLH
jgi:16S rRNA (adenine1518-N6/adenine1519-N6)-dimethyltransferase